MESKIGTITATLPKATFVIDDGKGNIRTIIINKVLRYNLEKMDRSELSEESIWSFYLEGTELHEA